MRRDGPTKLSQFSFQRNTKGEQCVVYKEDHITKTNDGGLNSLKKECKVVMVHPSSDVTRCPVRLIDKYISLLPPVKGDQCKHNFYLRSLEKPTPAQWYSNQVVGLNTLHKTVGKLLKDSRIQGFVSNHSLKRSGASRLFQAGVEKKVIREYTGHHSDALNQYQVTSEEQKRKVSDVLAGNVNDNVERKKVKVEIPSEIEVVYHRKEVMGLI